MANSYYRQKKAGLVSIKRFYETEIVINKIEKIAEKDVFSIFWGILIELGDFQAYYPIALPGFFTNRDFAIN